jgi:hypothetical protein
MMLPMESPIADPVSYPTITLGDPDIRYPLRYRHKDIVSLWREHNIDITQRVSGIEAVERMPAIIAAGLAHLKSGPTFAEVKAHIEDLDAGELSVYSLAVMQSQKKVSPAASRASEEIRQAIEENGRATLSTATK